MRYKAIIILALSSIYATPFAQNLIAATPPMGWNSWNHFNNAIDDATVRSQADAMVSSGMKKAGYVYINIDDSWEGDRDSQGFIHSNKKFPDMKALAGYVHSKGLKLGIYSSPGSYTCASYMGSYQHEEQDAKVFAEWGIDYLKYDLCSFQDNMDEAGTAKAHQVMVDAYKKMYEALLKVGRPIVFSLCEYGMDEVWKWGASVGGNLWRTTGDISDDYARMAEIGFGQAGLAPYATPGHWNDPDMLEVGNGGMTTDEYKTHMSLWALLAAPLLAGNDLTTMSQETIDILTNPDVVAIDQDKAGKQGDRIKTDGSLEIWSRELADGSKALGFFNRSTNEISFNVKFNEIGCKHSVKVKDIWAHKELGVMDRFQGYIPAHGVVLLRVE
jgi:alpha-galactosidase